MRWMFPSHDIKGKMKMKIRIAEESVDTGEVMHAFQSGDSEIESQGCTEVEVE